MKEKINLIKKYVEKYEQIYGEDDGFISEEIENMINYRMIRTEEAWYAKNSEGEKDSEERRKISARLVEYDKRRRSFHNLALTSINTINSFGEKNGLEKFYDEEILSDDEIDSHSIDTLDRRKEITDFMLKFVEEIQEQSYIRKDATDLDLKNNFIQELSSKIQKIDRDYGVEEPLLEDDGDIKFKPDSFTER